MHGNVWEWCQDGPREYSGNAMADPMGGQEALASRALRGGAWGSDPVGCRSAFRLAFRPGNRLSHIGFRVVFLQAGPEKQE